MILVDYSHRCINAVMSFPTELKGDQSKIENLIRHVILSTLLSDKKKYGSKYGSMVLCCDSRHYWRKDFFPYYKGSRKKSREKSDLPWELILNTIEQVRQELVETFPYKVILVDGAEGDDVIAVLTKWLQTNELKHTGLFEEPQEIMIISADHDFKQLQKYDNVKQWSPMTKALVVAERNYMTTGHRKHLAKAGDDGIPSVLNRDDILITEGERQKPMSASRLAEFVALGIDACRTYEENRNWIRNQRLIDFDFIPKGFTDDIINQYLATKPTINKNKIMNYLIKNRCAALLDSINDF
jgi:hypothetical protein